MTQTMTHGDVTLLDGIEVSEPGNAERLALIAHGRIHYVDTWNTWVVYRNGKWELDGGGVGLQAFAKLVPQSIFALASSIQVPDNVPVKEADVDPADAKAIAWRKLHIDWARKSNTEPTLKRMVNLARDLPGMRITSDDLDAKPHLLNLQNGTFNFTTGEFQEHDPGDLLTKRANAWYDPTAKCPQWLTYLAQWQPDALVRKFLQSITGSGLVGIPVQNLFVNVGAGRNGKGTFYKQIQLILGDYAGTAPEDMLVETRFKVHDEEKARLRGCRLLIAPETSAGDRLDESGIKNMTGGDLIHARHLYGRPFDFMPTHTAFLHTNYEPHIKGTDPAIWNRVIKIPWDTYIKEDQRDMSIDQKLEAERSGVLNWLIAGCKDWLAHGLRKPPTIVAATEEYRVEQDTIGRFLEETMEAMVAEANSMGPLTILPAGTLRKHYEMWCQQEGTKAWTAKSVGRELRVRGWNPDSQRVGKVVIRGWKQSEAPDAVTTRNTESGSDLVSSISVTSVTPYCLSKVDRINEEESENAKEVNTETGVTDVTGVTDEEDREADHRQWLYDHGYPVPPTEAELEAYINTPHDEPEYEDDGPPEYEEGLD